VLAGLGAAHKAGILHRDLKPENVLLADDGRIKIGDFGLARATSANTATGAALLGTIAYLSPELVTRGVADTRSDIYAVGIMMYEMLTGEQPFTGEQPMQIAYRHANEPLPAPSSKNSKVPRELDELVLWATAKDPDQRPADARTLLEQVRDTEALLDLPAGTPARPQKTQVLPAATGGSRRATDPALLTSPIRPERPFSEAATQVLGSRRSPSGPGTERRRAGGTAARRLRRRMVVRLRAGCARHDSSEHRRSHARRGDRAAGGARARRRRRAGHDRLPHDRGRPRGRDRTRDR
jgi:serine/threonine protein kinase